MDPPAGSDAQGVYGHPEDDEIVARIPIHISRSLTPHIHLHQFPLLTRPLEVPESARVTGKRIKARSKPEAGRYEIHVPVDTRPAMWNAEQAKEYGAARVEEDAEERRLVEGEDKSEKGSKKGKGALKKEGRRKYESDEEEEEEQQKNAKTLKETRLRSERITTKGDYFVGVLRDGQLYLHPISQVHQFRPTLTYMDVLSRKTKPTADDDDDGEEETAAPAATAPTTKAAREVVVAARGTPGESAGNIGGLSALRRDMISTMRKEQEERWVEMQWDDEKASHTSEIYEGLFSAGSNDPLRCTSKLSDVLTGIKGLTKAMRLFWTLHLLTLWMKEPRDPEGAMDSPENVLQGIIGALDIKKWRTKFDRMSMHRFIPGLTCSVGPDLDRRGTHQANESPDQDTAVSCCVAK